MILVVIIGAVLLAAFIILLYGQTKGSNPLPPGPRGLPLLGNFLQIVRNPHLKLSKWAKQYGKLYTIKLGSLNALVVSDAKLMKELFALPASTGKFKTETIMQLSRGPFGVLNTEGQAWQEQRQFCIRTLVQHGFGNKKSMEPLIFSEIQEIVNMFIKESNNYNTVTIFDTVKTEIQNILWTVVTGERIGLQDQRITRLAGDLVNAIVYSVKTGLLFLPLLKYIAPKLSGYTELEKTSTDLHEFVEKFFDERRKTIVPRSPRDMIDSYLDQLDKHADNLNSSFHGATGPGGETTSNVINWLVLYLCYCPNVQAKMHEEIDRVVGKSCQPSLNDRKNMPYTEAVIQETLRKSSVAYIGAIHELLQDVEMFGYKLPKGLLLIANIYHVHHDQEIWGDPENFRPERFLQGTKSDLKVIKSEHFVPFQAGKRECLGVPLAKDLLFLFVTKLFQTFQFLQDPDKPILTLDGDVGQILYPQPFKVRMIIRG